jgi:hypothetical protein
MATLSLQRSREELKRQGYQTWIVEKPYNPYTKRREDCFNLFDLIAIRADIPGVLGIQACGEDISSHISKVLEGWTTPRGESIGPNPYLPVWLRANNRAFIWAWRKRGERGKRKTWELREIQFIINQAGEVVAQENKVTSET